MSQPSYFVGGTNFTYISKVGNNIEDAEPSRIVKQETNNNHGQIKQRIIYEIAREVCCCAVSLGSFSLNFLICSLRHITLLTLPNHIKKFSTRWSNIQMERQQSTKRLLRQKRQSFSPERRPSILTRFKSWQTTTRSFLRRLEARLSNRYLLNLRNRSCIFNEQHQ